MSKAPKIVNVDEDYPPIAAFYLAFKYKVDIDFVGGKAKVSMQKQQDINDNGKQLLFAPFGNTTITKEVIFELPQNVQDDFFGKTKEEKLMISSWTEHAITKMSSKDEKDFDFFLQAFNHKCGELKTMHLVGENTTIADLMMYETLKNSDMFMRFKAKFRGKFDNVYKYFSFYDKNEEIAESFSVLRKCIKNKESSKNMITFLEVDKVFPMMLPNAKMGEVVTRFPPEASGYLHIGHGKAALINWFCAKKYNGKMLFRFDDTNPEKESEEFEEGIKVDLKRLGINYDPTKITYTSDYFEKYIEFAKQLIKQGDAYCCDLKKEDFKILRNDGKESKNRNNSVETNLKNFEEMIKGTEYGQKWCLRAKMDMTDPNRCCRDPVMYRYKNLSHARTGKKYCIYPTYDWACPLVDSIEGVTHALRTSEYNDRNKQYYWFCDKLGIRKPMIFDYSRANFFYTVMSKRKLKKLVESGFLEGWDDPRLPTIRALLRRGIVREAIEELMLSQASSRKVANLEWDKLFSTNKEYLEKRCCRFSGMETNTDFSDMVPVDIEGFPNKAGFYVKEIPFHPKDSSLGTRKVIITKTMLISQEDASNLNDKEEFTMRHLGNVIIKSIEKDSKGIIKKISTKFNETGDVTTTKWKLTWLPQLDSKEDNKEALDLAKLAKVTVVTYGNLLTKNLLEEKDEFMDFVNKESKSTSSFLTESIVNTLPKGTIFQIERLGFFIIDSAFDSSKPNSLPILIAINDNVKKGKKK